MPAIVADGSSAISYAGSWSVLTGSSSEYSGGAVHSSSSSGSTATIRFSGEITLRVASGIYWLIFLALSLEIRYLNYSFWHQPVGPDIRCSSLRQLHFGRSGEFLGSYCPRHSLLQRSILGLWPPLRRNSYSRGQEHRLKPGLHA
jgi:hypothetical protein